VRVAVVGAGIIGLSIAWELARSGAETVVLDPAPAAGATRAAAGMLGAVTEFHQQEQDLLPMSLAAAARWPGWAADLRAATGNDPGHRAAGTLVVAADAADRQTLQDLATAQRAAGLHVEELGPRGARAAEPLLGPRLAGAFRSGDGQADPRRTAAALRSGLAAMPNARLVPATVRACATGPHPAVEYDGGRLACDEIVLATGSGPAPGAGEDAGFPRLTGLEAALRLPVRPVYGDVLRLSTAPGGPEFSGSTIRALVAGHAVYVVPRATGEVVVGATEREDGRPEVNTFGVHRLLRDALRVVPALGELDFVEATARARPGTPDNLPLLGRAVPGLVVATGFHRHGVLLSAAAAEAVRRILGGSGAPDFPLDPFDPWRFS
jgi:glycine oxidase